MVPILVAIVAIGVFPKPLLDRIEPAADRHVRLIAVDPTSADAVRATEGD